MSIEQEFIDHHNSIGLNYISANELLSKFRKKRNGIRNSIPPKNLWPNCVEVLRIADRVRAHFNQPITILSTYRSPAYNTAIKGAKLSRHLNFDAVDLSIRNTSPKVVAAYIRSLRDNGVFEGGIGVYAGFVHVDTRGVNVNWG